jgi:hypothetical protein
MGMGSKPEQSSDFDAADLPLQLSDRRGSGITIRSVLLGLVGVIFVCTVTPYNDFVLNNNTLIGYSLPIVWLCLVFLFAVIVNGPLNRWSPRLSFTTAELTVAGAMVLVSCAMPASGLMRYFPPTLVSPLWLASANPDYLQLMEEMTLPAWLLPRLRGDEPRVWLLDPIVSGFMMRWGADGEPYSAWIRPMFTWGIFLFLMWGSLICLLVIVRQQWYENERLPFPLAEVQLALLGQPRPGQFLNDTFRRRGFWIAAGLVFLLHGWNGMAEYQPRHFPAIPLGYDLRQVFSEPPWVVADHKFKANELTFIVVGATYFVSLPVAFSLWFFFVAEQSVIMFMGSLGADPGAYAREDQHFGAVFAFALVVLWLGRRHWKLVVAQAFRGPRADEPTGRYLSYPAAAWLLVVCVGGMLVWLVLAGSTIAGALATVLIMLTLFMVITRIVAETGLVYGQLKVAPYKPWQMMAAAGYTPPVSTESFYVSSLIHASHYDMREPVPLYASHAIRLRDRTMYAGRPIQATEPRSSGAGFLAVLLLALFVGYFVSFGSILYCQYGYAATTDTSEVTPINEWGAEGNIRQKVMDPTLQYHRGSYHQTHHATAHFAFGFALTWIFGILRMTFTWWPLHPIGFVMLGTSPWGPAGRLWFSLFIGWLAKAVILRLGGLKLFRDAKPFFIGMILGEALVVGFFALVSLVVQITGGTHHAINLMP